MFENMYKDSYNEIVTAGKLISKLNQLFKENMEISEDLKNEISDILDFLRSRARYYQKSYREEIAFQEAIETYYDSLPSCYEFEYNCNCKNMDISDYEE